MRQHKRRRRRQQQYTIRFMTWLLIQQFLLLLGFYFLAVVEGQLEITGGFMDNRDYGFCYEALMVSDTNSDNEVDKEEYVEFSRFLSPPGLLDGITSFNELPLEYKASFFSTACLCSMPAFGGTEQAIEEEVVDYESQNRCCFGVDAHIRVPPSSSSSNDPVDSLSSTDRAYLYAACAYTNSAAQTVLENPPDDPPPPPPPPAPPASPPSQPPATDTTPPPTPVPTPPPSPVPTPMPSSSKPTSAAPSDAPSMAPSSTLKPTTNAPTAAGPVVTTSMPSQPQPTIQPTAMPTVTGTSPSPSQPTLLVPAHVTYSIAVDEGKFILDGNNNTGNINNNNNGTSSNAAGNNDGSAGVGESGGTTLLAVVSYLSDLQVALNRLASTVAREFRENCVRRRRKSRRRLQKLLLQEEEESQRRPLLRRQQHEKRTTQQQRRRRRSLQLPCDDVQVRVQLPTKFESVSDMECPAPSQLVSDPGIDFTETTLCRNIEAIAPMDIVFLNSSIKINDDDTLVEEVVREYEAALSQAIDDGRLQTQLDFVNPDSPVTVLPPFNDTTTATDDDEDGSTGITDGNTDDGNNNDTLRPIQQLSPGAKAGIGLGVVAFAVLVPLLVYLIMRRGRQKRMKKEQDIKKPDTKEIVCTDEDAMVESKGVQHSAVAFSHSDSDGDVYLDETGSKSPTDSPHGLVSSSYGRNDTSPTADIVEDTAADSTTDDDEDGDHYNEERALMIPQDARRSDDEESSGSARLGEATSGVNAGAAAAGVAAATTLAAIGAAPRQKRPLREENDVSDRINDSSFTSDEQSSHPSVAQLESHIEAGDWAAVGATAAILAAASDSQSATSRSAGSSPSRRRQRSPPSSGSGPNSVDAARAAELDQLVDAGDWDGLIAAAAKFEDSAANTPSSNASSRTSSSLKSSSHSATSGSDTGTGGSGTIGTHSYGTSGSESPSKAQRRDEIRSEVEALVRRVVPEEIDNIDEMMNQFKGREEELVETLRTMQERSIAQKARSAGQKAAKAEARRIAKESGHQRQRGVIKQRESEQGVAPPLPGGQDNAPVPPTSTSDKKTTTVNEISPDPNVSSESATTTSTTEKKFTALEMAIDSGDWQAVGEAAAILSDATSVGTMSTGELDRLADASLSLSSAGTPSPMKRSKNRAPRSLEGIDAERASELDDLVQKGDWAGVMQATKRFNEIDNKDKRIKASSSPSKEEEEALKQAELWTKLAEKKKAEGATDHAGASDAAEWAIQRSLSQMKEADAEKQKKLKSTSATNADKEV